MKTQETVNKNFHKVISQWKESQERKIANITEQQKRITEKIEKLNQQYQSLNDQIKILREKQPPEAPTETKRIADKQQSLERVKNSNFKENISKEIQKLNFFPENR